MLFYQMVLLFLLKKYFRTAPTRMFVYKIIIDSNNIITGGIEQPTIRGCQYNKFIAE